MGGGVRARGAAPPRRTWLALSWRLWLRPRPGSPRAPGDASPRAPPPLAWWYASAVQARRVPYPRQTTLSCPIRREPTPSALCG